jgi:hypothetical protein
VTTSVVKRAISTVDLRHAHVRSPPFRRQPPVALAPSLCHATPQRDALPGSPGPDFASRWQDRRMPPAESRSSSYGRVVHLRLLPTPPRGGAVTIGYRSTSAGGEDLHLPVHARLQAH